MLAFDAEPLAQVVAEFNRYNDRELVIRDPTVASLKIGGYFRRRTLTPSLRYLKATSASARPRRAGQLVLESTEVEEK